MRFVGIACDTSRLSAEERARFLGETADDHNLPCVDPLVEGVGPLLEALPD